MATSSDSNLLLIVKAAQILEQNEIGHNNSGHNGYSPTGSILKRNKRMKSQIAQAPTTVEVTDLDAYEVEISQEENPYAKDEDEDEDEESDDSNSHSPCFKFPKLKFQSNKSVSQAKQVHNEKEKIRRKTLKQAQMALHKVLHPHSHQKPVLRIILCNAIYEIKRLQTTYKENENCLAALKERQNSLAEQLESLKSLDISQDEDVDVRDDGNDSDDAGNEDNNISRPQSVDSNSFLDVEEEAEDDLPDDSVSNEEVTTKQAQEKDSLTSMSITMNAENSPTLSQSPVFSSSYPQLYYYTQLLGCTTLMQLHTYMNGGNLWLPPYLWPNVLHSTVAGISGNTSPVNPTMHTLNEAAAHQSAQHLVCSPPVKCSVVKSIGSIDSDRSPHESLSQNSTPFFCRQLC